jgi:hypothetical protein
VPILDKPADEEPAEEKGRTAEPIRAEQIRGGGRNRDASPDGNGAVGNGETSHGDNGNIPPWPATPKTSRKA